MKRFFCVICFLILATATFAVPNLFNYQGKLTNTDGIGINADVDITVRIYDAETGGTLLDSDALTDVPVIKGLFDIQYEVDLTSEDLEGDLFLELEIDGNLMIPRMQVVSVPFALSARYAVKADSIGDYAASDFDHIIDNDLQGAYDAGNAIITAGGNAVSITAGTGTALYLNSPDANGIWNDANYWSPDGDVSLGTGTFHSDNGLFQSNTDFVAKLDANDDEDATFSVRNSGDIDVFSVTESGLVFVTNYLNVANITNAHGDTIWIDRKVWVDELVTDTIESRGDVVFLKDAFGIRDSLWFDGEWRKNWPTGGGSGDFIEDQYTAPQDAEFWIEGRGAFGLDITSTEIEIWSEDFEGPTFPPTGWTQQYVTGTTDWVGLPSGLSGSYTHTGSGCAVFEYDDVSGDATSLITPIIDLSAHAPGTVFLQFWHMQREWLGDQDTLALYYSNDGGSSWNLLGSWSINVSNYILRTFTLPNLSDQYQIMFYGYEDYGYGIHIDDILIYYVDESAAIPKIVANGNTGNIELLTATGDVLFDGIGLTTTGGAGVVGYDNSASGLLATDVQGAIDEMAATPIITKLDTLWAGDLGDVSDTIYAMDNFYINGELIVDSIQAKGPRIFLDDHITVDGCATIGGGVVPSIVLLDEDFADPTFPPTGWTATTVSGTYNWERTTLYFSSSPASARFYAPVFTTNEAELITPSFDISGLSAVLTFNHCQEAWGSDQDSLHVYYRTGVGEPWQLLERWTNSIPRSAWASASIPLPDPTSDYQIRFLAFARYGYGAYIDDVRVSAPTGASPPKVEICAGSVIVDEDVVVSGDVEAGSFTLNGITITDWPTGGGPGSDTIWSEDSNPADTIVAMSQFKVYGELIADSIQAAGTRISMDDSVEFTHAVSLAHDSTWRTDWEPQFVITVGLRNADFMTIDAALAAIAMNGWTEVLIDVAPGIYPSAIILTVPRNVHIRGSGADVTTIVAEMLIEGKVSNLTFSTSPVSLLNSAHAMHCNFVNNVVTILNSRADNCFFKIGGGGESLNIRGFSFVSDCQIGYSVDLEGGCVFSDNLFTGTVTVHGMISHADFNGCVFADGNIVVSEDAQIFVEACIFNVVGDERGPAIYIMSGSAEIKANHFVGRAMGAIQIMGGRVNIVSNDVIECGASAMAAIFALPSPIPSTINILGNHIDGHYLPVSGIQLNGAEGCLASLKNNIIEGHGTGAIFIGMNLLPTDPLMPIDNNLIYKNQFNGLTIENPGTMGRYLITNNTIYSNALGGGGFDLNIQGGTTTVSHNVLDTYMSVTSPVPGALNSQTAGMVWVGAPQIGQLP